MENEKILLSVGFTIPLTDEERESIKNNMDQMLKNNEKIGMNHYDFAFELMALGYHNGQASHHLFLKWFKDKHPFLYKYIMKRYER